MSEPDDFGLRLRERASLAGVTIATQELVQLAQYYELLVRWNRKINLTALPLVGCPDESLDRLFIEPFFAARFVNESSLTWLDVGSGGGSPAIPLKIIRPLTRLFMTEPRERKAAFLREVVRRLGLNDAEVLTTRVETLRPRFRGAVDLVTLRAVRLSPPLAAMLKDSLKPGGRILSFGTPIPPGDGGLVQLIGPLLTQGKAWQPGEFSGPDLFVYVNA